MIGMIIGVSACAKNSNYMIGVISVAIGITVFGFIGTLLNLLFYVSADLGKLICNVSEGFDTLFYEPDTYDEGF